MQRKEVYRCNDRTGRYGPPPSGSGFSKNSRNDEFSEVKWKMETIDVNWNGPEVQTTQSMVGTEITQTGSEHGRNGSDQMGGFGIIENSLHSTVDSGRDSGSAAESASGSEDQFRLVSSSHLYMLHRLCIK